MVSETERPGMFAANGVEPRGFKDSKQLKLYHERTGISSHSAKKDNRQQWREAVGPRIPSYTHRKPLPPDPASSTPAIDPAAHLNEQRKILREAFPQRAPPDPVRRKPVAVSRRVPNTTWRIMNNPDSEVLLEENNRAESTCIQIEPHPHQSSIEQQSYFVGLQPNPRLNEEAPNAGREVPSDSEGTMDDGPQSLPRQSLPARPTGPPRIETQDLYTGPSILRSVVGSSPPKEWFEYPEMGKRPPPPPRIPTLKVDSGANLHDGVAEFLTSDRESVKPFAKDMPAAAVLVKGGVKSFIGSQKRL
jgi:hypothetical protein